MMANTHAHIRSQPRFMAAPVRQKLRPAFTVEKLPGTRQQKLIKFDDKGKKKEVFTEMDAGYLVTIYRGDSFRVTSAEELHRLGFDNVVPMVDDDGEVGGYIDNPIVQMSEGEKK